MATLIEQAATLLELCRRKQLHIATAESCTGGLVAAALTEIAGSSDVVDRGFVTYSNEAKQAMLGVPAATLEKFGAVSRETAEAMAQGALAASEVAEYPMDDDVVLTVADSVIEQGERLRHGLGVERQPGQQRLAQAGLADNPAGDRACAQAGGVDGAGDAAFL